MIKTMKFFLGHNEKKASAIITEHNDARYYHVMPGI